MHKTNVMAKNIGLIKIDGTLGDLTFYTKDGKNYIKRKTTISKSRILNAPEFQRTRENMQEFAGSALIGKDFRRSLILVKSMSDRFMHNRLFGAIKRIINLGLGNPGERVFEIIANKQELIGFEFHKTDLFGGSMLAPFSLTANGDKNEATLNVPIFNASDFVIKPQGATHFKLVLNVSTLTDYIFNPLIGKYESTNPALGGLTETVKSGFQSVIGDTTVMNLVATLPGTPILTATEGFVVSVGIEYYQEINGNFYLFAQGNAMRIQNIF